MSLRLDIWINTSFLLHHVGEHRAILRKGSHRLAGLLYDSVTVFGDCPTILHDIVSNVMQAAALTLPLEANDYITLSVDLIEQRQRWRDVHVGASFGRNDVLDYLNDIFRFACEYGRVDDVRRWKLKAYSVGLQVQHFVEVSSALLITVRFFGCISKVLSILRVRFVIIVWLAASFCMMALARNVICLIFEAFGISIDVALGVVLSANHRKMLPLDSVNWHIDFVDTLHVQVV